MLEIYRKCCENVKWIAQLFTVLFSPFSQHLWCHAWRWHCLFSFNQVHSFTSKFLVYEPWLSWDNSSLFCSGISVEFSTWVNILKATSNACRHLGTLIGISKRDFTFLVSSPLYLSCVVGDYTCCCHRGTIRRHCAWSRVGNDASSLEYTLWYNGMRTLGVTINDFNATKYYVSA